MFISQTHEPFQQESRGMECADLRPLLPSNLVDMMRDATPSHLFDYVYMPISKSANTDMKRTLWQCHVQRGYPSDVPNRYFGVHNYGWLKSTGSDPSPWDCYLLVDYERLFSDMLDGAVGFRFIIARNPFARLLSGYSDKILRSRP